MIAKSVAGGHQARSYVTTIDPGVEKAEPATGLPIEK
jgi:hypothetical protein